MLRFAVLSLLVVSTEACCTPTQWEMDGGKVEVRYMGEELGLSLTNSKFHYDADNFRIAMTMGIFRDPNFKNKTIWDYREQVMYSIDEMRGICEVMPLNTPFQEICTPEGARVADHFFYGGGDQMRLPAATFEYDFPDYSGFVSVTEGTEPTDTCVPIVSVDYSLSRMTFMTFENIEDGIKDPTVFDPPVFCDRSLAIRRDLDPKIQPHPILKVPLVVNPKQEMLGP